MTVAESSPENNLSRWAELMTKVDSGLSSAVRFPEIGTAMEGVRPETPAETLDAE
jgi:hypothetical protein